MTGVLLFAGCGSPIRPTPNVQLQEQVVAAERAFAATMAQRDREAFRGLPGSGRQSFIPAAMCCGGVSR